MNPATEADALNLANGFCALLKDLADTCAMDDVEGCTEVVLFPPFPFISKVKDIVGKEGVTVGAQQVYYEDKGAFTGSYINVYFVYMMIYSHIFLTSYLTPFCCSILQEVLQPVWLRVLGVSMSFVDIRNAELYSVILTSISMQRLRKCWNLV